MKQLERRGYLKPIETLYLEYKQDIYQYLLSLSHDHTFAEDLLSETFVKAICSIATFKEKSTVKTWLFGIARNVWLQSLRKRSPTLEWSDLLERYIHSDLNSLEDTFITKQTVEQVYSLLDTKDERTRTVFHMRIESYSYYEIAQRLNISENSARVIDFRTRKWLKAELEKE